MTPIGHFMCSAAVGGNADLLSKRQTVACFAYYALFLLVFLVMSFVFQPGTWAMYLHDWFGNAALIFFLIFWGRGNESQKFFVCVLIGAQILAAYTHIFDRIFLYWLGSVPSGMWRPHNILHTPMAAAVVPLVVTPLVAWAIGSKRWLAVYLFLSLGYFSHIFADTITYNYQIYPLWPFSGASFSLAAFFQAPDAVGRFLGNPLYIFSEPNAANIDGFIVYKAELLVNFSLAALFGVKCMVNRVLRRA